MGYFSCRAESAVITCESHKKDKPTKIHRFRYRELELATNGFSPNCLLGKGSHGCVYRAVLESGKVVAVKRPSPGALMLQEENPGENEIEILSRIHNPRLVNLLGYSSDHCREKLIVVQYMCNGTLYDLLHSSLRPPGWGRRVRLALQIAKGIETLHSENPPVIHRDIKSSNVLIDENWNARVGDFGLALRGHIEDIRVKSTPPAGTIGYLDPGYLTPGNISNKSDVFSFGILLLEMISGRNAIDVNYSPASIVDWALPLIRQGKLVELYDPRIGPPQDQTARRHLAVLAARCVRSSREKRPSMSEVVSGLKIVSRNAPLPIWNNIRKRLRKMPLKEESAEKNGSRSMVGSGKAELSNVAQQERRESIPQQKVETSEEITKSVKSLGRTSLRNTKVSDLQSSVDVLEVPKDDILDLNSSGNRIEAITEIKVRTGSDLVDQLALVKRTGIAVRMPGVRLKSSRTKTPRLVREANKGSAFRLVKNPSYVESELVTDSKAEKRDSLLVSNSKMIPDC